VDSARAPAKQIETEYLLSSRPAAQMNAAQMLKADRNYWGIETGLHLRLDVIAGEDRSRVRKLNAVMNLAVIRRAVVSLAVHWINHCKNRRQASMSGFYDFMSAHGGKRALKLVTVSNPTWLPHC
jgi:predicted transposase YbfD/YdcC